MKFLIGTKVGMTQLLDSDGAVLPVTLIQTGLQTITQIKTAETDGYTALQLGYGAAKRVPKALAGHLKKADTKAKILREFRLSEVPEGVTPGNSYDVSEFEVGDKVKVTGISKGKGFAGTVKRWNFNTGPKTHGSQNYRKPGSIGSMYPQKVIKGKKMAGRLGHERVAVRNLKVAMVDPQKHILGIKGAVPGPRKSVVLVEGL